MRKFATFDCETDPFKRGRIPKPFLWGYFNGDVFRTFHDTEKFVEFIRKRKEILYAHNGGKFDLHFLWDWIEPQDRIMVVDGRVARIKIGDCEIRDSFMLFPIPLKDYKKDAMDYEKMELENRAENMDEITDYLRGDCVYLHELLSKNFELYGQKISLASSAFTYWHKQFSGMKLKPKTYAPFFDLFKPYYYGGRVECFQKGIINKPFRVYDIRSAYPRAMLEQHPFGSLFTKGKVLPDSGIEKCFVELFGISDGVLPFRDKSGLSFPNDGEARRYYATGWEVKAGLETGKLKILKIENVRQFEETITFRDYVYYFYNLKESVRDKSPSEYLLAKLYLNSLYGKFGMNPHKHKDYELIQQKFIASYIDKGFIFENIIGKYALVSKPIDENKKQFYNVATAASITGWVRAFLFSNLISCDEVLYCDTDSIACRNFGGKIGRHIGDWNFEGEFERGAIAGKKLYVFTQEKEGKVKHKISSKGVRLSAKDIYSIAKGEKITYYNEAPTFSVKNEVRFLERVVSST